MVRIRAGVSHQSLLKCLFIYEPRFSWRCVQRPHRPLQERQPSISPFPAASHRVTIKMRNGNLSFKRFSFV